MIVGFGGKMGSGKDTAAAFLVEKFGYKRYAFADNLKQMCMKVFDLSYDDCYDQDEKFRKFVIPIRFQQVHAGNILGWAKNKNGWKVDAESVQKMQTLIDKKHELHTPREVLQFVGTEVCREVFHPDYHALVVKHAIDTDKCDKAVIADVRFKNERDMVKEWDGLNFLITGREIKAEGFSASHASENSLGSEDDYDGVIDNSGSMEDLENEVSSMFNTTSDSPCDWGHASTGS